MFRCILVPLDGTSFAEAALTPARELADLFGARLLVTRAVAPPHPPTRARGVDTQFDVERLDDADAYVHGVVNTLRAAGYDADLVVYGAEPDAGIARVVALDEVDLVVMAAHPRWQSGTLDHTSTTLRLLDRSSVPILVWHAAPAAESRNLLDMRPRQTLLSRHGGPILVPLDGSSFAEKALPVAEALARGCGSAMLLVRAVSRYTHPAADSSAGPPAASHDPADDAATAAYLARGHAARVYLKQLRAAIALRGISTITAVRDGAPFAVIKRTWQEYNANLIVMASHHQSWFMGRFLSSTAASIIETLDAPVLVLRPDTLLESAHVDTVLSTESSHEPAIGV
jgi:nucleotide-binding universal stress UspA family protein